MTMSEETPLTPEQTKRYLNKALTRIGALEDLVETLLPLLHELAHHAPPDKQEVTMQLFQKVKNAKGNVGNYFN